MKDTDGSLLSLAFSTILCYSVGVVFLLLLLLVVMVVAEKKGSEQQQ
jgi:Na+-transporting methylmalonyl-CoA/oxaloacetate decarboxylase gamma subunit